jgi:hypothetical protein
MSLTRDDIIALLDARDPLAAAEGVATPTEVTWTRGTSHDDAVHTVRYGAGTTSAQVADRLLEIAAAPAVRTVHLVPGADTPEQPGSWGNEDLLVTAVARRVLPHVAIRPDWASIGGAACQVAVSFGADDWVIPDGDDADPERLAQAVGARAVAR